MASSNQLGVEKSSNLYARRGVRCGGRGRASLGGKLGEVNALVKTPQMEGRDSRPASPGRSSFPFVFFLHSVVRRARSRNAKPGGLLCLRCAMPSESC